MLFAKFCAIMVAIFKTKMKNKGLKILWKVTKLLFVSLVVSLFLFQDVQTTCVKNVNVVQFLFADSIFSQAS